MLKNHLVIINYILIIIKHDMLNFQLLTKQLFCFS